MTPIIVPCRNNLHLTREAVKSFRAQDVPVEILVIDNASTDGTGDWLKTQRDLLVIHNDPPKSVAASWNQALRYYFIERDCEVALVVNNDVRLRPDTVRWLLAENGGFVTAVGTNDPEKIKPQQVASIPAGAYSPGDTFSVELHDVYAPPNPDAKRPHPDFSCFLIRREVYRKVGAFDEAFSPAFCEDSDYDCRMWKAGIRGYAIDLPFLHYGSQTIKNADDVEARWIARGAEKNRAYFKKKWGFEVGSDRYYEYLGKAGGPE